MGTTAADCYRSAALILRSALVSEPYWAPEIRDQRIREAIAEADELLAVEED